MSERFIIELNPNGKYSYIVTEDVSLSTKNFRQFGFFFLETAPSKIHGFVLVFDPEEQTDVFAVNSLATSVLKSDVRTTIHGTAILVKEIGYHLKGLTGRTASKIAFNWLQNFDESTPNEEKKGRL